MKLFRVYARGSLMSLVSKRELFSAVALKNFNNQSHLMIWVKREGEMEYYQSFLKWSSKTGSLQNLHSTK